jgi:hypothetical protein
VEPGHPAQVAADRLSRASALLVVYGALNGLLGALVLSGVIHPAGSVDLTALRWHVEVSDMWFLVWGTLLALATVGYWRRTATRLLHDGQLTRSSVKEAAADG